MTTYKLRDAGIFTDAELEVIQELGKIQTFHDAADWATQLENKLYDELQTED